MVLATPTRLPPLSQLLPATFGPLSAPVSVPRAHSKSQPRRVSSGHSPQTTGAQQWDTGAPGVLWDGEKAKGSVGDR